MWYRIQEREDSPEAFMQSARRGMVTAAVILDNHSINYSIGYVVVDSLRDVELSLFVDYTCKGQESVLNLLIGEFARIDLVDSWGAAELARPSQLTGWNLVYGIIRARVSKKYSEEQQ